MKSQFETYYDLAVKAAMPERALREHLPKPPKGRLIVIGAGKGAAQLAASFETDYEGSIDAGLVVTRYGFGVPTKRIEIMEASHPVPDENSILAGKRLMDMVQDLNADDLVVALITGGGSALLAAPLAPMNLQDEIALNEALLASGAPIGAMNTLRRHVSAIKGGRLADAVRPARLLTLLVSDVPGDDPAEVASGPTVSGQTTPEDAKRVIAQYDLALPSRVYEALSAPAALCPPAYGDVEILASAKQSLEAVEVFAKSEGWVVQNLGDALEGEARELACEHAALARKADAGTMILSGGETTVTLKAKGKGGRNTEYLLALAIALDGFEFQGFAADTDGVDGSEDNAGAFADGTTCARLRAKGLDPQIFLDGNDAYSAFEAIGDIFAPGPSGTNVNDLRIILIP